MDRFSVGDRVSQFIVTASGAMGVIDGIVTEIFTDRLKFKSKKEGSTVEEEHIVTIDLIDTLL